MTIPVIMGPQGAIPTSPTALNAALIAGVQATNPGYTANLPGSLIEDISSTCVGALASIDQARVDAINSVTPYGANEFITNMMGAQFGIQQGASANTSVYVIFTSSAGFVVPAGEIVSDGNYTYVTQNAAVCGTNGQTPLVYCVSPQAVSWAVAAGAVNKILTTIPTGVTLTVTNPSAGIPSVAAETPQEYRSRVLAAQTITGQGTPTYLKTLIGKLPGVSQRLLSILQVSGGWEVICGGGDQYQVAGAIYLGTLDLTTIVGSTTTARNITVSITDAPNTYNVVYVNPPQQLVTGTITWNTTLANFINASAVNATGATACTNYINTIPVGQPINETQLTDAFAEAVAQILPPQYLTRFVISISINGTVTSPTSGTNIIPGDPESYFFATSSAFTVAQG